MKDQDSIFFKNFSIMLGALMTIILLLVIGSNTLHGSLMERDAMSEDRTNIAQSIKPVAQVNTGDGMPVVDEPVAAVAAAFEGSTDGVMIFQNVCSACHSTGAGGAPKLESAAWVARMKKGVDGLVDNAIHGYQGTVGYMPAKGGRADLSDEQVKATVEYMLSTLE